MIESIRRALAAGAVIILASYGAGAPALARQPQVIDVPANASKPGSRGLFNDWALPTTASRYGRKSAGISMAQQQRTAAKKRSVARNRRHHR